MSDVVLQQRALEALESVCSDSLPEYDPNRIQQCLSHTALQRDQDHEIVKRAQKMLQQTEALRSKLNGLRQQVMSSRVGDDERRRVARGMLQFMGDPNVSRFAGKLCRTVPEVTWFMRNENKLQELAKEPPPKPVTEAPAPAVVAPPPPAFTQQPAEVQPTPVTAGAPAAAAAVAAYDNSQDQYITEARQLVEAVEQFKTRLPEPNVRDVGANRLSEDAQNNASWRNDARALLQQAGHDQQARLFQKYVWDIVESKASLQEENNPNPLTRQFVDGVESLLSFCVSFQRTRTSVEQLSLAQIFLGGLYTLLPHTMPDISLAPTTTFYKKLDDAAYGSAVKAQIEKLLHTHQNHMRAMGIACNLVLNANLWRRWAMKTGISGAQGGPKVSRHQG